MLTRLLPYTEIESKVCDIVAEQLAVPHDQVSPGDRLIEDLGIDSLELVELLMGIEEEFDVTLPGEPPNPVYKSVFTRGSLRLADLAELAYLQQGTGVPKGGNWRGERLPPSAGSSIPFTQLGGRWNAAHNDEGPLWDRLPVRDGVPQFRRRSDGMRCLLLSATNVEIGNNGPDAPPDEQPRHVVQLDSFLIDAEPVSTTAYCRFLNSVGDVPVATQADWFLLDPTDVRNAHVLITRSNQSWQPLPGTARWPMVLVSWYGANAYSLWANGRNWRHYRGEQAAEMDCFLPSEAQWEYAARGARYRTFPWGDEAPNQDRLRYMQHRREATYQADTLPLADVNAELGMSPFGVHHMAGNVWQWCQDWYDPTAYASRTAAHTNPVNRMPGTARSERGGSWIGPADLCRSSCRRGRPPAARGRCLGFRCISPASAIE